MEKLVLEAGWEVDAAAADPILMAVVASMPNVAFITRLDQFLASKLAALALSPEL